MKTVKLIIVLVSLMISISCCHKEKVEEIINDPVDQFVELLKSGNYEAEDLPAFTYLDIPALLAYRNQTEKITNFPAMEFHLIISKIAPWVYISYGQLNQLEQLL